MNKLSRIAISLSLILSGSVLASVAVASTATTTFPVTATVIDSCSVEASPLAFGQYNAISGGMLDASATITPTCTVGTFYSIALNEGLGNGATKAARKLGNGDGSWLNYGIFTDTARNTVWGDGAAGTSDKSGYGAGTAQPITMYGRIPAAQAVQTGAYADTITVTLTY